MNPTLEQAKQFIREQKTQNIHTDASSMAHHFGLDYGNYRVHDRIADLFIDAKMAIEKEDKHRQIQAEMSRFATPVQQPAQEGQSPQIETTRLEAESSRVSHGMDTHVEAVKAEKISQAQVQANKQAELSNPLQGAFHTDRLPHVPAWLKQKPNWVLWRMEPGKDGKPTKVPYQLDGKKASHADPKTWTTYDKVKNFPITKTEGIGICMDGSFIGFDLDGCRNPQTGEIAPWAKRIIDMLGTYTEITPSGCGVRGYVKGALPDGARRFELNPTAGYGDKVGIEVYDKQRYFCVTGDIVGTATGLESPNALQAYELCKQTSKEFPSEKRKQAAGFTGSDHSSVVYTPKPGSIMSSKLAVLMYGTVTDPGRPFRAEDSGGIVTAESHSEADMSLCTQLAVKYGDDPEKIDSEFRESSLYRAKWEPSEHKTYAERTINKAIESAKKFADKPSVPATASEIILGAAMLAQEKADKADSKAAAVSNAVSGTFQTKVKQMSEYENKKINWLWEQRIPIGESTAIAADPDEGKTLICLYVAAKLSRKELLYGATEAIFGETLILSAEDDPENTLGPRLDAAGADKTKIWRVESVMKTDGKGKTVEERELQLDTDIQEVKKVVESNPNIKLVIIDPISSYLGKVNMNAEQEVRRVLKPLVDLARLKQFAVVLIIHFNKNKDAKSAIDRVGGAKGLIGLGRAAWTCHTEPRDEDDLSGKDKHLLLRLKNNLAPSRVGGLTYEIKARKVPVRGDNGIEMVDAPYIEWTGTTDSVAQEVLVEGKPRTGKLDVAKQWLQGRLEQNGGTDTRTNILSLGQTAGHTERTLHRAKDELRIKTIFPDGPEAYWALLGYKQPKKPKPEPVALPI